MSLLLAAQRALTVPGWAKDELSRKAQATPSLDLRFADNKSLVDATTGQNLVSFTRASSGTYVDSQGVIRTATTNLLLQSESFASTDSTGLSNLTVTTNTIAAPNGTITADSIAGSSNTSNLKYWYKTNSTTTTGAYTASVYLKVGTQSIVVIRINDNTGANGAIQSINLATGTLSGSVAAQGTATGASASISSIGDGWYRCSITCTFNSAITSLQGPAVFHDGYTTSTSTNTYYAWGAQLEQSSTVGEYIPTTSTINSAPRFDHNPTTGESLGLLVEEQRTNLLLLSGNLYETGTGGGSWIYQTGTMSDNTQVAPDGTTTADTLTTTGGALSIYQSATVTASTTYTGSVYVRLGTMQASDFKVAVYNNSTPGFIAVDVAPSQTPTSSGWTRISYSFTTPAGCTSVRWYPFRNSAGLGSCTVHLWGAQLEAGAFATSYIPTTTAAATRSADVASISGSNFSSWYRQDEGTVFAEARLTRQASVAGTALLGIETGSTNTEAIYMHYRGSGLTAATMYDNSTLQADFTPYGSAVAANTTIKQAFGVKLNDSNAAGGGIIGALDTNCTLPTPTLMQIGTSSAAGNYLNGTLRRITYWSQRLPDSVLASITQ